MSVYGAVSVQDLSPVDVSACFPTPRIPHSRPHLVTSDASEATRTEVRVPDRETPFVLDKLRTVKNSPKSGKRNSKGARGRVQWNGANWRNLLEINLERDGRNRP